MRQAVWMMHGTDYQAMAESVLRAADLKAHIGAKDTRIGIKPNLVTASPASHGATTHVELVEGIIAYLHANGFKNLTILEGAWVGARTAAAFDVCGYKALSRRTGVPLIDTQQDSHHIHDCEGIPLSICDSAMALDFLINVPVMKGHCQTNITCALKNMKGLLPDSEKRRFHTMGLHKPIAHLNARIRQGFVLVDAICGDLNFEEGGNPVTRNQVFGCYDPVLCDAYVCSQLGYAVADVPYIGMAARLGIGMDDVGQAALRQLNGPEQRAVPQSSRRVQTLARHIQEKDACSACYANLIYALERLEDMDMLSRLQRPIAIGQGYKGQQGFCGVGHCTAGHEKALDGCPPKATDMVAFLLDVIAKSS